MALEISTNSIAQISADTDTTTELDVSKTQGAKYVGVQAVAAALTHNDGVLKLQDSIDGANWEDVPTATKTFTSPADSVIFRITNHSAKHMRVVYTKGSNTAGTVDVTYQCKN